jgi:hypothetical protein
MERFARSANAHISESRYGAPARYGYFAMQVTWLVEVAGWTTPPNYWFGIASFAGWYVVP